MKIKLLFVACALALSQSAVADNGDQCDTDVIEKAPNPLIEVLTIPFKMIVAITYGPRCALDSIPKNEE